MKKLVAVNVLGCLTHVIVEAESDVHAALITGTIVDCLKHGKTNDYTGKAQNVQETFDAVASEIKVEVTDLPEDYSPLSNTEGDLVATLMNMFYG